MALSTFVRWTVSLVIGCIASVVLLIIYGLVLYPEPFPPAEEDDVLSRSEEAVAVARERMEPLLPGSYIDVQDTSPDEIVVQKYWLGLKINETVVHQDAGGWRLFEGAAGAGEVMSVILTLAVPTTLIGFALVKWHTRRG